MKKLMGTAFLVLAVSGAAMAQHHGHGEHHGHSHMHPHGPHGGHGGHAAHGQNAAAHFADQLRKRLDLSDEQAAKVKDILDGLHKEMEGLENDLHDKATALRSRAWTDIRATLSEKQRPGFDSLVEELEKRHAHHGHAGRHDHGDAEPRERGHAEGPDREQPRLGEEVKDFALTDSAGKALRLESLRRTEESKGEIAVLTFWCTMCHSCRSIDKDFDKKARAYREKGVQFFAVASNHTERAEGVNQFRRRSRLSFPVLMDPESQIARYFGAKATTTTAVVDAEGRLRYYGHFGKAEEAVWNLMAGEEVAIPETRPMGCRIMMKPVSGERGKGEEATHEKGHRHGHGERQDHEHGGGR